MGGSSIHVVLAALVCLGGMLAEPAAAGVVLGVSSGKTRLQSGEFDGDDRGFKIFGGYRWHDLVGVEAQYTDLGKMNDRLDGIDARAEIQNLCIALVGAIPLRNLELFAKAGLAYSDVEAVGESNGTDDPLDEDDGVDLAYGVGAALRLRDYLSVRGEIEWFEIDGTDEVELVSFGLDIRF